MKNVLFIIYLLSLITDFPFSQQSNSSKLTGPYFGQEQPGNKSKIFAPEFISTEFGELNSIFTQDGKEFYFSRRGIPRKPSNIMVSKMIKDVWTKPEPVEFTDIYSDIDLFITKDGGGMIFCSNRPHQKYDKEKTDHDFWISKRQGNNWSEPVLFAEEAASKFEDFFPVVTKNGNLYFNSQRGGLGTNDIYCSRFANGKYLTAEKLPEPINSIFREFDAYVSPDESMIIFSSERPGGFGCSDIYICFKKNENSWTDPLNMGEDINSPGWEYGSSLSPEGKFFFYTSDKRMNEDIYWVSSKIIEDLKVKAFEHD